MIFTIDKAKEHLKSRLNEKRYYHSLCVADAAKAIAEQYSYPTDKAYIAGLIHDVMRNESQDNMQSYINKHAIVLDDITQNSVMLWHAVLGADYIQRYMGINDLDIINAVRYHTTARKNMSTLEKIIYLADCSSTDREYWNVEDIRKLILKDMNKAMYEVLDFSIKDLTEKGKPVHPDTLEAIKEYMV